MTGRITKATGGFYYVTGDESTVECRARGIFRKRGTSPCVGDIVDISISPEDGSGAVDRIHPRRNELIRPPLANLDYMVLVISATDPAPNFVTIDKYLAILQHKDIPVILAITKPDLRSHDEIRVLYEPIGYPVFVINNQTGEGVEALIAALQGKLCAFSGNSGVGKTSLLNAIYPAFSLETGDTSKKLGRGRHTTRHVEVHTLPDGTMIADTPGFSSLDLLQMSEVRAEELASCFLEFLPYTEDCRFQDCRHMAERDCAVRAARETGAISASRYASYQMLFNEIKDIKEWERK